MSAEEQKKTILLDLLGVFFLRSASHFYLIANFLFGKNLWFLLWYCIVDLQSVSFSISYS